MSSTRVLKNLEIKKMRLERLLYFALVGNFLLRPIDASASETTRRYIDNIVKETVERYDAHKHGITPKLVSSVILHESSYDSLAVSRKGARGLMQLMPFTAEELSVDPLNPRDCIDGGIRRLIKLCRKYKDTRLALAAYNCGETKVDTLRVVYGELWWDKLPRETRNYVANVLGYINRKKS